MNYVNMFICHTKITILEDSGVDCNTGSLAVPLLKQPIVIYNGNCVSTFDNTWPLLIPYLNGIYRIILVQFVEVIGDVGVQRCWGYWMNDSGIMRLLLISLAISVNQKSQKAPKNWATQPHSSHVEQIKFYKLDEWENKINTLFSLHIIIFVYYLFREESKILNFILITEFCFLNFLPDIFLEQNKFARPPQLYGHLVDIVVKVLA